MAYSVILSEADQAKINRLPILKQDEIKARTGGPLTLSVVYDTIGRVSNNRTDSDPQAEKADRLLAELLSKKKFTASGGAMPAAAAQPDNSRQKTEDRQQPAAPSRAQLEAQLRLTGTALKYESDPTRQAALQAQQRLLRTAIKFS